MSGLISLLSSLLTDHLQKKAPRFLMHEQKLEKDVSCKLLFNFNPCWHVFTGIEELQGPRKRKWSGLREIFNSLILNVITDAPLILTNHKKKPFVPPGDAQCFSFPLLDVGDTWRFCCFVSGGRNASRWKEKRVLVGAAALDFKPYKISNAPQSQTSN